MTKQRKSTVLVYGSLVRVTLGDGRLVELYPSDGVVQVYHAEYLYAHRFRIPGWLGTDGTPGDPTIVVETVR